MNFEPFHTTELQLHRNARSGGDSRKKRIIDCLKTYEESIDRQIPSWLILGWGSRICDYDTPIQHSRLKQLIVRQGYHFFKFQGDFFEFQETGEFSSGQLPDYCYSP